ncbi:MAG: hypothetical protein J6M92_02310 [Oribacterium sp.]|nr:hypothetical protein [Oribacterium sp.]
MSANLSFDPDMDQLAKDLMSDAMDILDDELIDGESEVICPHCKATVSIKTFKNAVCPACGRKIIASS